jgi:peptide deformylase
MPKLELPTRIINYPDPKLRKKCAPITRFDDALAALGRRMLELMHTYHGVGLAGPQVGICERIFVCNPTGEEADDSIYINPELSDLLGAVEAEEGCLSIPEVHVMVRRARQCRLKALDVTGEPFVIDGEDLIARIWQHETDHLDGRLILDRMNASDKIANKKQIAQLEADYKKAEARKKG